MDAAPKWAFTALLESCHLGISTHSDGVAGALGFTCPTVGDSHLIFLSWYLMHGHFTCSEACKQLYFGEYPQSLPGRT